MDGLGGIIINGVGIEVDSFNSHRNWYCHTCTKHFTDRAPVLLENGDYQCSFCQSVGFVEFVPSNSNLVDDLFMSMDDDDDELPPISRQSTTTRRESRYSDQQDMARQESGRLWIAIPAFVVCNESNGQTRVLHTNYNNIDEQNRLHNNVVERLLNLLNTPRRTPLYLTVNDSRDATTVLHPLRYLDFDNLPSAHVPIRGRRFHGTFRTNNVPVANTPLILPSSDIIITIVFGRTIARVHLRATVRNSRNTACPKVVIEKLPEVLVEEPGVCAICQEDFVIGDTLKRLSINDEECAHGFHSACILPWLKQHNSCPVCRYEIPTEEQLDNKKNEGFVQPNNNTPEELHLISEENNTVSSNEIYNANTDEVSITSSSSSNEFR